MMTSRAGCVRLLAASTLAMLAACAAPRADGDKASMTPDSRLRVAEAAEGSGDRELAVSMYLEAAQAAPSDIGVQQRAAEGLARNGRLDEAAALLRQRIQRGASQPDLLRTLGAIEVLAGQPTQAEAAFSQALAARPDDVKAMADDGIALDLQHRHVEAQAMYRKALSLAPGDPDISNNLALSLALSGHVQEARQVLLPFRDATDVPERVRINLGILEAAGGNDTEAQKLLAGSVDPTSLAMLAHAMGSGGQAPVKP